MPVFDHLYRAFRNISNSLSFTSGQTSVNLTTIKGPNYTIFIHSVQVYIETSAAQNLKIQSSDGALELLAVDNNPSTGSFWEDHWDGEGLALPEGTDLKAVFSAAGLAGSIKWTGYQRKTS